MKTLCFKVKIAFRCPYVKDQDILNEKLSETKRKYIKNIISLYLGKDVRYSIERVSCCPRTTYHQSLGADCHSPIHDIVFHRHKNGCSQKKLSSSPSYHLCSLQQKHIAKDLM